MELPRGDSRTFDFTCTSSGTPIDLTGATITFTVYDLDGETVLELANTAGGGGDDEIEVTDASAGEFSVKVTALQSDLEPTARWANCVVVTGASQTIRVADREPFYVTGP